MPMIVGNLILIWQDQANIEHAFTSPFCVCFLCAFQFYLLSALQISREFGFAYSNALHASADFALV